MSGLTKLQGKPVTRLRSKLWILSDFGGKKTPPSPEEVSDSSTTYIWQKWKRIKLIHNNFRRYRDLIEREREGGQCKKKEGQLLSSAR